MTVVRAAPAKLNLTLAVLGRREDGFHSLHSVMVPLGIEDTLSVEIAGPGATADTLVIPDSELPASPENLVLRAVAAAREAVRDSWPGAPAEPPFLAARLVKRIPVAAGLAGGSSDAAAAVAAALEAWGAALAVEAVAALAVSLGSDVPFFLAGGAALVTGRGEHVEPLPPFRGAAPAVLLVTPRLAVATGAVFGAYSRGARPGTPVAYTASERLAADMRAGLPAGALLERAAELAAANDLLPATLSVAPALAAFRRALGELLGRPIGQSGSGPTAWALYPSLGAARGAAALIEQAAAGKLVAPGGGAPFVAATTVTAAAPAAPDAPAAAP